MKTNTMLGIVTLCVICAATMMSGCLEVDDPIKKEEVETIREFYYSQETVDQVLADCLPSSLPTPTPTPTVSQKVPTSLELSIGETAANSETTVTVVSVRKKYYYEYLGSYSGSLCSEEADYGNTFVFATVNMKNIGKYRALIGSHDLSMTDSEGFRYDRVYMRGDNNELAGYQELYQNQQTEGVVLFEVPKDATGLKIQYDFGNMFGRTQIASWKIPDKE